MNSSRKAHHINKTSKIKSGPFETLTLVCCCCFLNPFLSCCCFIPSSGRYSSFFASLPSLLISCHGLQIAANEAVVGFFPALLNSALTLSPLRWSVVMFCGLVLVCLAVRRPGSTEPPQAAADLRQEGLKVAACC